MKRRFDAGTAATAAACPGEADCCMTSAVSPTRACSGGVRCQLQPERVVRPAPRVMFAALARNPGTVGNRRPRRKSTVCVALINDYCSGARSCAGGVCRSGPVRRHGSRPLRSGAVPGLAASRCEAGQRACPRKPGRLTIGARCRLDGSPRAGRRWPRIGLPGHVGITRAFWPSVRHDDGTAQANARRDDETSPADSVHVGSCRLGRGVPGSRTGPLPY